MKPVPDQMNVTGSNTDDGHRGSNIDEGNSRELP